MKGHLVRGYLQIAIGIIVLLVTGVLAIIDKRSVTPQYSLALLIVLAVAGIASVAAGVNQLMLAREIAGGAADQPVDYRHTYRLFGLLGFLLVAGLTARSLAVPDSFGREGFFRGDARVDAMAARVPRFQGKQACVKCHEYQFGLHEKDVHRTVQCENCHGPADVHVKEGKRGNIELRKTKDLCLTCHRQLTARPGPFPQVTWQEHYKFVGVQDEKTECIACHDPHEPLFLETPVSEARLHPLVHRCRDCHLGRVDEKLERPPEHPAIFECKYCHKKIGEDFDSTPHYQIMCTTCHLFQRESDFAGRIVRNKDPRFCLLCHEQREFRQEVPGGTPLIDWAEHLAKNDSKNTDDTTPCVKCHQIQVHVLGGGTTHE